MTRLSLWRLGGPSVLAMRGSQRRPPRSSAMRVPFAPSRTACHRPPAPPVVLATPGESTRA
eukprot:1167470-Prymnesium_polylepis.1